MERKWNYFTEEEVEGLDTQLVAMLDQARHFAGIPFQITSGFRPGDSEGFDNGVKQSAHMNRKAVDLRSHDSVSRYKILSGLYKAGFTRIGINNVHVHADIDESKPSEVFWLEPNAPVDTGPENA